MSREVIQLADFDPELLIEYAITNSDLTNVYYYLQAMQAEMWPGSWEDIGLAGYYGSSALLHEGVEVRLLLSKDPYLLTRSEAEIKLFARQIENRVAISGVLRPSIVISSKSFSVYSTRASM
jgi:hypothetical protein